MKSNVTEFNIEMAVGTVTPTTCLMNRLAQVSPLNVSSEENPPKNPSESSRRLL